MKKWIAISVVVVCCAAELAVAGPHHGRHGRHGGGHHGGGHHGGGHNGKQGGGSYGEGVLAGLLLSTSALFFTDVTANHSQAVYLHADQDAAVYLAEGGQPTPALAQAMAYERNFLARAEVQDSQNLSDQQVAYLVMKRAESL